MRCDVCECDLTPWPLIGPPAQPRYKDLTLPLLVNHGSSDRITSMPAVRETEAMALRNERTHLTPACCFVPLPRRAAW